tara:strand:- start:347 stop:805 length:459 start_codon:yes stop_codon:yes gene_type:complete
MEKWYLKVDENGELIKDIGVQRDDLLLQALPELDLNDPDCGYVLCDMTTVPPTLGLYEELNPSNFELIDEVWKVTYTKRAMTDEERAIQAEGAKKAYEEAKVIDLEHAATELEKETNDANRAEWQKRIDALNAWSFDASKDEIDYPAMPNLV